MEGLSGKFIGTHITSALTSFIQEVRQTLLNQVFSPHEDKIDLTNYERDIYEKLLHKIVITDYRDQICEAFATQVALDLQPILFKNVFVDTLE
jgi:hypothetical protein